MTEKTTTKPAATGYSITTAPSTTELSGIEKTAILLNVLGKEKSFEIMKEMTDSEVRKLLKVMGSMRKAPVALINSVLHEYLHKLSEKDEIIFDDNLAEQGTVKEGLGEERAKEIFGTSKSVNLVDRRQLSALEAVDPIALAEFLFEEHPQTIALVMAHLDINRQTKLLRAMPEPLRPEILQRMASLEYVSPEKISELDEVLKSELTNTGKNQRNQFAGIPGVAELVNQLDNRTLGSLMSRLDERDPVLAEEIRARMFTFADIVKIDAKSLQIVLREVPNEKLLLALKSAPDELREKVSSAMSERAAKLLADDLAALGPQKVSDVEGAQREISAIVQRLMAEGIIQSHGSDDQEVIP